MIFRLVKAQLFEKHSLLKVILSYIVVPQEFGSIYQRNLSVYPDTVIDLAFKVGIRKGAAGWG